MGFWYKIFIVNIRISGSAELLIQRRLWYTSFDDKSIWIHVRVS